MTALHLLWLPVLLSAVIVFVASSILHMAIPWHKGDYRRLPDQDNAMAAIRALSIPPGDYLVPCPGGGEDMRSAAFAGKIKQGPVMVATVMPPGRIGMGRSLVLWFLYCLAI